jgi:initiation factor 1A
MREQEDENLARNFQRDSYDYELEFVKKLSLEDRSVVKTPQKDEISLQEEIKQYEEDELLALFLQREERSRIKRVQPNALKVLTPLECKILHEPFRVQDQENDEEEETEYNYTEPYQLEPSTEKKEYPILYDDAQKKEDKEIGHVLKRMPEKRVNASPLALHHKPYATRNKGKVLMYGSNRSRPTPKSYSFPLKNEQHNYGYVTKVLGGCRFLVFCYITGRIKLCRMSGKLVHSRADIKKGSVVLYRIRVYQGSKGDIIFLYSDEEYDTLLDIGELLSCDPKKLLPTEIWKKILTYLDPESLKNLTELYNNSLIN